jgi:hypothetical protein
VLRGYLDEYPAAVTELRKRLEATATVSSPAEAFRQRLDSCSAGQEHFADYEGIGIDVFRHLFPEALGEPTPQSRTLDGKQRRDVLFRNRRQSAFWDRIFHRFGADLLIVDFKNHEEPVDAAVVFDVDKYANKALGRFIVVVCRRGADSSVEAAQLRVFRDANTIVLVLSDAHLLEMIQRKERTQHPEDVIEDALDELLRKY